VRHLARFQLTRASRGPSVIAGLVVGCVGFSEYVGKPGQRHGAVGRRVV